MGLTRFWLLFTPDIKFLTSSWYSVCVDGRTKATGKGQNSAKKQKLKEIGCQIGHKSWTQKVLFFSCINFAINLAHTAREKWLFGIFFCSISTWPSTKNCKIHIHRRRLLRSSAFVNEKNIVSSCDASRSSFFRSLFFHVSYTASLASWLSKSVWPHTVLAQNTNFGLHILPSHIFVFFHFCHSQNPVCV